MLWALVNVARAVCGLDVCPAPPRGPALSVSTDVEVGEHTVAGQSGGWSRALVGLGAAGAKVQGSVTLPYVAQRVLRRSDQGVGNLLAGVQWDDLGRSSLHPMVGAQLELPVGAERVAHLHVATLPWLGVRAAGRLWVDVRAGVRAEVGGWSRGPVDLASPTASARVDMSLDHTEPVAVTTGDGRVIPPSVKLVDPHDDVELVARAVVGPSLGSYLVAATADVAASEVAAADVGVQARVAIGRVSVRAAARVPVTSHERFAWRAGAGLTVSL